MKKLFILTTIFSIVLSLAMFNSCAEGYFCCEEKHQASTQCSNCSPHMESAFSNKLEIAQLVFIPSFLGEIYFDFVHTDVVNFIFTLYRPPAVIV